LRQTPREATAREAAELWPAVRSERLFDTAEQFSAYCAAAPWRIRVTDRGDAAVLGVWREHLDVLALRGVWCSSRRIAAFVADARALARERELGRVLSPLLPLALLGPYRREGMRTGQQIMPIQGHPRGVLHADPPLDVCLRPGRPGDLETLVSLDAECFDEFWRYGRHELADLFATERLVVAENGEGRLIGYTLATVSRGAATLGRLGVARAARRTGLGSALVFDVAQWADSEGAETISLCTQVENAAARRLYAASGLAEVSDAYGFAIGDVAEEG
jgi:[ribosomal protein S18]-alanine N-acetyltransferase